MKIEEIFNEWETDSNISSAELDTEALKISKLQFKYFRMYSTERIQLKKLEKKLDVLKLDKTEFYTQGPTQEQLDKGWKFPGGRILKNEVKTYLDADKQIIELSLQIDLQNEKIDLLNKIISSLSNRSFQIKHAIEWIKWTNGER